jgi:hypothetical protein
MFMNRVAEPATARSNTKNGTMRNLLILLLFGLSSCIKIYGLKRVRAYSEADIQRWSMTHNISTANVHGAGYIRRTKDNIADKGLRKDLQQPLQYWIFDSGKLVSNMVNCDATGFPNLKWPIEENFRNKIVNARNAGPEFYPKFTHVQNINPGNNTRIIVINYARLMG